MKLSVSTSNLDSWKCCQRLGFRFIAESYIALKKKTAGGRGDTGTLRSTKSEESLTSLHNVEGNFSFTHYILYTAAGCQWCVLSVFFKIRP